jgi:glycosyltransferase involved in cell wall biosynthesis
MNTLTPKLDFRFVSADTFEPWDWNSPVNPGIGGSETSHVEMARRLAEHGHQVSSWAPIPAGGMGLGPADVYWRHVSHFIESHQARDFGDLTPGTVYVIYREPKYLDLLPPGVPAWIVCQDINYRWTKPQIERATRIVALCGEQAEFIARTYPDAKPKLCISSNGVRSGHFQTASFQEMESFIPRNHKRLIYASSPDRGLWYLLDVYERAKEFIPDLELVVAYGFDNIKVVIEKMAKLGDDAIATRTARLLARMEKLGVQHLGRLGQFELYKEWLRAGIWCHPSSFPETSCITCMDAQSLGAIPITNPYWAVKENVRHGVLIEGTPQDDALCISRYVQELLALVNDPDRQAAIRQVMMPWARKRFDWENFVSQWERWATGDCQMFANDGNLGSESDSQLQEVMA